MGGQVNDTTGDDQSESRINLSEVLIFQNRLALPDQRKIEGFLAHKWALTGGLESSHPYKTTVPTFNDPISAVDLTLYWGPNDGGTNPAIWENNVSLGRFYGEEKVDGFSAKAYEIPASLDKTQAAKDYFADINQLLALTPSGSAVIQGDPGNPTGTGMYLSGDADFQFFEMGIDVGADRFMIILETDFLAPSTGSYTFRSDINGDKSMLWIDLDQNGKYERIGKAGAERLSSVNLPGDITFDSVNLTAGQSYRMAFMLGGIGGTHQWELKYQTPGMGSLARIKPLQSSQDGLFTTTRLSNQSIGDLQTKLEANATGLVAGNTLTITVSREPIPQVIGPMRPELLSLSQPFLSLQVLSLSIQMDLLRDGHLPMAGVEQGRLLAPPILTASQTVFHIKRLNLTSIAFPLGMVSRFTCLDPIHFIFKFLAMPRFPQPSILMAPVDSIARLMLMNFSKHLVDLAEASVEKM